MHFATLISEKASKEPWLEKEIADVDMGLTSGGIRELHWHTLRNA